MLRIRIPHIRSLLLVVAVIAGPVVGFGVYRLAARVERDRVQAQLEHRVATAALAFDREFAADLEVLYALRSHFDQGAPVTRERFVAIARPFLARHSSIRALEWVPRVAADERGTHEQRIRDQGITGYTITERVSTRELAAAGIRDWHYPVTYVEPFVGNEAALGFDLGSDSARREAIDRASVDGDLALTRMVDLVQGERHARGVLALLPIFTVASDAAGDREEDVVSFVIAVLEVELLLQQAGLGPDGAALTGVEFGLLDDAISDPSTGIHGPPFGPQLQPTRDIWAEQAIDVGGRRLYLIGRQTDAHANSLETRHPLLLGTTAGFAWELLVGLLVILGKRAHDRLERRHAKLMRDILESLSDGVIVADTDGRILLANRAATTVSGRGPTDILPSDWSRTYGFFLPGTDTLFPPDRLPLARAIRGEVTEGVEVFVRNPRVPDGTHVSVSGAPLLDGRGSVRGGVVVVRDITRRKRAEERLQRLSSAVEQTADSVLITDRSGTIEYVNPAFEATTGYSHAEAVGRKPNILKSGVQSPDFYRDLWATILRGEPFRGMTVNRKKSGELYHAEQTITAMKDRDGRITHFVSVLKDMTERHRMQQQEIELQLASMVQRRLFPDAPPRLSGYDLAGTVFPAAATCGDYFDFVPMSNGGLALVIADVSGHGLGSALVMAETRAYLRSAMQATDDLAAVSSAVNRFLVADLHENFFVTMLLATLELATGRLAYVNSAHPSGYILDRSGEVRTELASGCLPLGLFLDRWRCATHEAVIREGELAVLVTDGVLESEAPDGTEFGVERLLELVSTHRQASADEIVREVHRAVQGFSRKDEQVDDVTVVVCKRSPADASRSAEERSDDAN